MLEIWLINKGNVNLLGNWRGNSFGMLLSEHMALMLICGNSMWS